MVFLQEGEVCKEDARAEVLVSVSIDEWSREYRLCDGCAEMLRSFYDEPYIGGLIPQEMAVMDRLVEAWNDFMSLAKTTAEERQRFMYGVHIAQDVLASRVLGRIFPNYWSGAR
jgi:hypothetical protein